MNILICGHRAYAARGLAPLLENAGHKVVCFSRGSEGKDGNIITGDVKSIDRNPFIEWDIDVIVNFILLKDGTPQDNIEYISALCRLAKKHHVAKLIHLSSISSYPNDAAVITDNTEMDHNAMLKGKYGSLKVLVDEYLIREREMYGLPVILLRPGFIASEDHPNPLGGIAKVLPGKIAVLIGNRQSTLPLVYRNEMHQVLKRIIEKEKVANVYIAVSKGACTKAEYAKTIDPKLRVIGIPKGLTIGTAKFLRFIGIFDDRKLQMVRGMFKTQDVRPSTL